MKVVNQVAHEADEGGFSAAARRLGLTLAVVSKKVAQLDSPVYLMVNRSPEHLDDLSRHRGLLRRSLAIGRLMPRI